MALDLDEDVQELMRLARQIYNEYNEELRKAWGEFKRLAEKDCDAANDDAWYDLVIEAQNRIYRKYRDIYLEIFHEDYIMITVVREDWVVSYSDGEWALWNTEKGELIYLEECGDHDE